MIDFGKAPEGATHYDDARGLTWIKFNDGVVSVLIYGMWRTMNCTESALTMTCKMVKPIPPQPKDREWWMCTNNMDIEMPFQYRADSDSWVTPGVGCHGNLTPLYKMIKAPK
jgi:hypothetical protein